MQNPVVHRSVRMIAEAAASVPMLLFDGDDELIDHPLQALLARPNPVQSGNEFLEACYGYLLVAGNAYVEAVPLGDDVRELYPLRPDRMTVIAGADGWPEGHEYTVAGRKVRFPRPARQRRAADPASAAVSIR